jgi:hypothetical protein
MSELELAAAQRAFARAMSALEGGDTARSSPLFAWLRADRGLAAPERMQIYTHAYFARIHGVLRDDFPALQAALGDAAFHDLAKLYLMAHPPRHYSLRFAGAELPAFLRGPVVEVFRRRWPFAADLAALEWARVDVFDAPDSELLTRDSLTELAPERWNELRLGLTPATRVLALEWPVSELREAWAGDLPLPALERRPAHVLVHRRGEEVRQRELSALEARALGLVREGNDFESLCGAIAEETGEAAVVERVAGLLERWLADQLLSTLSPGAPSDS